VIREVDRAIVFTRDVSKRPRAANRAGSPNEGDAAMSAADARADALAADRPAALGLNRIRSADVLRALRTGHDDFLARPSHNALLGLLYPAAGMIMVWMVSGSNVIELLFPLLSGFALVGPIACLGLLEISRRRAAGEPARWSDALSVARHPSFGAMLRVGLVLFALFVGWLATAAALYDATVGAGAPRDLIGFAAMVATTPQGHAMALYGNLAGFGFALAAMAIGTFSLPLLLDGVTSARRAMAASAAAVAANPAPMALWGLLVGGATLGATVFGLVGLSVVLPVAAHATWALYAIVFADVRAAAAARVAQP
jgi:uncharacterized membrane protein